ncbi:Eukaryotic translation initiation factor 2C [Tulasnella sp. JGI-2019a]|nr:Eukaryotic translation initiation factor 2C [Tulasnella sp. JGI-2019a]KAG9022174.1 Eukaryotic translation initiation factor 2C [Tulasnella sp. JGI-2019a]
MGVRILGTNRSAHYSCLVDENNFTADELQQLSFSLCYIYARATQSVSIVAPTYYADIVCARAKHHYDPDEAIGNLPDLASGVSSGAAEARANLYKERFRPLHPDTAQNMYFQ